jgi:hypothetical protein
MLDNALYNILRNDSGVSALVTDAKGIAFSLLPTGVKVPAIVIHRVSGVPTTVLEETTPQVETRYQFDCYASQPLVARQLARYVKLAVTDLAGNYSNGDSPETVTTIQTSYLNSDFDAPFEQGGDGKGIIYRSIVDVTLWISESFLPMSAPSAQEPDIDGGNF